MTAHASASLSPSYLLRATAAGGTLRLIGLDAAQVVEEARQRHQLSKTATAALGRALMAAALLAVALGKRPQSRVTLRIEGGGPLGFLVAEGSNSGELRGYVREPGADLPLREQDGKLDVGGLVGQEGQLSVTRLLDNGEPYTGSVALVSGEIAEDLSVYLGTSEQIPNVVLLGVYEEGGQVTHAGGLLIQAMPGCREETLQRLEQNVLNMRPLSDYLREGGLLLALETATVALGLHLAKETQTARFQCRCSRRRAIDSLHFFSATERQEMIDQGGQEVVCHWCAEHYQLTPEELLGLDEDLRHAEA